MMRRVKIAELKSQLSKHLRAVERGAELEVTDRDRPIARIVPVHGAGPPLTILPARRAFAEVRRKRSKPASWAGAALEALLADRRKR
jgi:prevent-host-death family protein